MWIFFPFINAVFLNPASAGVGRTGVFIAVETACCLIEAGVAVYPEQMLDTLRDQRPSLIQTPVRYFSYSIADLCNADVSSFY